MSKYVLIGFYLLLCGCFKGFSQADVDEAARIQGQNRERCETIAKSLDGKSDFRKENGDWLCLIYKKTYLNNPWIVFYIDDLGPINRYLYIKKQK